LALLYLYDDPLCAGDLLRHLEDNTVAVRQQGSLVAVVAHGHAVLVLDERVAGDEIGVGDVAIPRSFEGREDGLGLDVEGNVGAQDIGRRALVEHLAHDADRGRVGLDLAPRLEVQRVVLFPRVRQKVLEGLLGELLVRV